MTSTQTAKAENPYLSGFLAPVSAEVTATDLEVTGHIPEHLDGRYLRNGPNPAAEVDPATYHWFSGDGMVHGVSLRDGQARWYRNRWVRSPAVCRTLGESLPGRPNPRAGMSGLAANTNVLTHAGRTLALVEGGVANYELTDELDTVGPCDFDGTLAGGYTAHPHRDPRTGELHAVSYSFTRGRTVQYSVIDTEGHARRTVDIEVTGSPMMHDFSLTDKYVVIYDLPVTFDPVQVLPASVPRWLQLPARLVVQSVLGRVRIPSPIAAWTNRDTRRMVGMPYAWNRDYPARIGVMPRDGWQQGRALVRHRTLLRLPPAQRLLRDPRRAPAELKRCWCSTWCATRGCSTATGVDRATRMPTLDRWTINLTTGAVATECRDDRSQEFPRINETAVGRPAPVRLHGRHRGWVPRRGRCETRPRRCTSTTTRPGRVRSPRSIPTCSSGRCPSSRTRRPIPRTPFPRPKMTAS